MSLSGHRFGREDTEQLWMSVSENGKFITIDKYIFRSNFDNILYTGHSTVREVRTSSPRARTTTIVSMNSSNSQWEADIIEKLR